ncbi:MAG TPA: HAD-IC family P-type ATPase [Actinomycetes bacterium]|nr:HAD-IC family P-type ATPase [Actinomycetes bacterium]
MTAAPNLPGRDEHHALPVHEVLLVLGVDAAHGLASDEAHRRLEQYGPNRLPPASRAGWVIRWARQFHNPLIYVLLAAALVELALRELVECVVILGVVLVNAVAGYIQESRAEAALDALRGMVLTTAQVLRDGRTEVIDSEELVPGDVVTIEAGDKVPADLRLVHGVDVEVDESALTGESAPVAKDEVTLEPQTLVADRRNMLYSGTFVTRGSGTGVVVSTGADTELGQIHRLVGSVEPLATPLTRRLAEFSRILTAIIIGLAAVTFVVGIARGEPWGEMFTAAVALAVGAIPEGLPAAVTITLAIGVARMAGRRAIVRRLPAVETLGSTTVICTDKTGTVTTNEMTVMDTWTPADAAWSRLVDAAVLCSDAHVSEIDGDQRFVGDPTEIALLRLAAQIEREPSELRAVWSRAETLPFTSEQRFMAVRCTDGTSERVIVKGATERVLGLCDWERDPEGTLAPIDRHRALGAADELASRGLRVIAVAEHPESAQGVALDPPRHLELLGLIGLQDPPRPEVAPAIDSCRAAGIEVKLITGDHATTAVSVAESVGLLDADQSEVLTGADLAAMSDEELPEQVARTTVFARIAPEQKLRLVEALQARQHVVAMTGDGVNDAPALRQANIGVAMGQGGTEVAKEAADTVLTDDNFATIEAAVEEGRGIFDNVVKFIVWTLPTNMGEGLVVLAAILVGATLPILPVQILWINMTTAVALGLMLAFEPKEAGIMTRPPRDPHAPLLTRALVERILLVSAVLVAGVWWIFHWQLQEGSTVDVARTTAVNLFVVVEIFYLLNCRSLTTSVWSIGWFSNPWVVGGVVVQVVAQLLFTYLPLMQTLFGTASIDVTAWMRILLVGVVAWALVTADKWLRRPTF